MSRSPLHGENNGLQQSAVCSLHFVLTDPTIVLVLIMMMMMMMMISACKKLEFQFILCASRCFHILIAWGHFLLVSVNDFVRG